MTDNQHKASIPISVGRAIVWMIPLYLLLPLPTLWWARQFCLLNREECGYEGIVDTIASHPMLQLACITIAGLLLLLTVNFVSRARRGTLGVPEDADEKLYNFNGFVLTVVVYALFMGVSLAVFMDAVRSLEPFSIEATDRHFWKSIGALTGISVVATILWHVNEYSVRPAPKLLQGVLFLASLGGLYWVARLPLLAL